MPLFEVRTNQKPSKEEIAVIASELSHVCSNILRKSEDYVMVNIQVDQMLLFAMFDKWFRAPFGNACIQDRVHDEKQLPGRQL